MEPMHQVTTDQVLAMLGAKEVELQLQRMQIAQLEAKVKELTPKTDDGL